ncbi:MAG: beta-propeller fold lactonase family protein [Myxococcota bacterium]
MTGDGSVVADAGGDLGDGGDPDGGTNTDGGDLDGGAGPAELAQLDALLEIDLDPDRPNELAFSADGRFLYASSSNQISVFAATDDGIEPVQRNAISMVSSRTSPWHLAVTPSHVYAYVSDRSLATFTRDEGLLREVEDARLVVGGASRALVLDASGAFLYLLQEVSGVAGWELQTFRLAADGTPTRTATDDPTTLAEIPASAQPFDLAIATDGNHAYLTGRGSDAVYVLDRDASTGALSYQSTLTGLTRPSALLLSPDGGHAYVAAGAAVFALAVDASGDLSSLGSAPMGGMPAPAARWLAMSSDGAAVYAGSDIDPFVAGSVTSFARDADRASDTFGALSAGGTLRVPDGQWITDLAMPPDDDAVFALTGAPETETARGSLYRLPRDAASGELSGGARIFDRDPLPLAEAAGIAVHPSGEHVYAAGVRSTERIFNAELVRGVSRLGWDGELASGSYASCVLVPDQACNVEDLEVAPDGTWAVGIGIREVFGAVFFFDVEDGTGDLTIAGIEDGENNSLYDLDEVADLVIVEQDANALVYVVDPDMLSVASRQPNGDTVFFTRLDTRDDGAIEGAVAVDASSDGAFLYLAVDDGVAVIDTERLLAVATRSSARVQVVRDGSGGVTGLRGAQRILVSPDDAHVYVVSETDARVAHFARGADGLLTFVESVPNGLGGEGEIGAVGGALFGSRYEIAMTPDGRFLLVSADLFFADLRRNAAGSRDGLAVFRRNADTGALTLARTFRRAEGGARGLAGASGVAAHPGGRAAFTSASGSGGVAAFALPD